MNMIARNVTPAPAANVLAERAMLVSLNVSQWTARRLDRKITAETNEAHGAAPDAGRFNKLLVPREALAAIHTAATNARTFHYANTLPWIDNGARLLPAVNYQAYTNRLRELRAEFDAAVAAFARAYPDLMDAAPARLNGMFNPADFPAPADIAGLYSWRVRVLPVPAAGDFRVNVGDAQAAAIRAEIEQASREATRAAMADAWQRVSECVARVVERLNAYKPATDTDRAAGVFRDSLVENVRELVALLPAFNLTNDPALERVTERMAAELCAHDAAELRESPELRESVRDAAAAILADVSAFI